MNQFQQNAIDSDIERLVTIIQRYSQSAEGAEYVNGEMERLQARLDLLRGSEHLKEHKDAAQKLYQLTVFGNTITAYQQWRRAVAERHAAKAAPEAQP